MRETAPINIQEPPVSELKKQRSCLKRSCFSGCGCIVFFFFGVLLLLNILGGTGYDIVKDIPETTPQDITIYESDRIERIRVSDRAATGKVASVASIVPKAILASIYLVLGEDSPEMIGKYYESIEFEHASLAQKYWLLLKQPITPEVQKIELTWTHLSADPKFIQEYYVTTLEQAEYAVTITAESSARRQIFFEKEHTVGSILIRDDNEIEKGTDYVLLTLSIPTE